ncbi:helix-hairpin-helix domain-containing protein [Fictibacillus iocasae]|uniref:Helix-hairpin-helix domain-containing protein n=1 Tax=Fictibacillus iocasae TaxID=2715437 RepID=A0ABW2NTY5_9BACL
MVRKHGKKAVLAGVLLVLFILYLAFGQERVSVDEREHSMPSIPQPAVQEPKKKDKNASVEEGGQDIWVDVKGEVVKPGVYQARSGKRVIHFIQLAGGFTKTADPKSVNLAAIATDEMVIYAAKEGEQHMIPAAQHESVGEAAAAIINVNSATEEELMKLPGVGPAKAAAIISYREENGPFSSMEDLLQVKGIGEKTAEQWAELISFSH